MSVIALFHHAWHADAAMCPFSRSADVKMTRCSIVTAAVRRVVCGRTCIYVSAWSVRRDGRPVHAELISRAITALMH